MLVISFNSIAQTAVAPATANPVAVGDPVKGKELFNTNCAACHKLDGKMTGPALRGVSGRRSKDWLYEWIKNSSAMIKAGDADAIKLFNENNKAVMTSFPQLSNGDIDNIIAYTNEVKAAPVADKENAKPKENDESGLLTNLILGALSIVLIMLVIMLSLLNKLLRKVAESKGIQVVENDSTMSIWKSFAKNQFLVLVTSIFLILASGYFAYGYFMQVGVDQDYEPVQPIHYSHRIHAGSNQINCKYCHSAARESKNAGIPSLNVCMNCHKNISEVSDTTATAEYSKEFYDGEIKRLYKAVGWDGSKYTGKTEPVKWVRIHNLPDFAYFNHSQHVSVAGLECQTCHGPVQTMEIMKQHSKLTMGWCIDCHRKTEVKTEGNEYYTKIHNELAKKYGKDKLTAAEMGGLECGKCHY